MKDKTILIVDDELELLRMLYTIFEREGYTKILTAASGRAALKTWREKQPDFIILDVMMPDMDGFAVLKEIRKTSGVPVLMLTARQEPEDKFEGFESGADDYLLKPFLPKELLFRVEAILKTRLSKGLSHDLSGGGCGRSGEGAGVQAWRNLPADGEGVLSFGETVGECGKDRDDGKLVRDDLRRVLGGL